MENEGKVGGNGIQNEDGEALVSVDSRSGDDDAFGVVSVNSSGVGETCCLLLFNDRRRLDAGSESPVNRNGP